MYGRKEGWAPKNWCFQTVVLEKTLEGPLDCKEIKPVNPKGYQNWIFIRRSDAEAKVPILWLPDVKSWFTGKDPDAGKDCRQKEKEVTGWDGWMASLTQWTWVRINSGKQRRTGMPGVLQSTCWICLRDWTTKTTRAVDTLWAVWVPWVCSTGKSSVCSHRGVGQLSRRWLTVSGFFPPKKQYSLVGKTSSKKKTVHSSGSGPEGLHAVVELSLGAQFSH